MKIHFALLMSTVFIAMSVGTARAENGTTEAAPAYDGATDWSGIYAGLHAGFADGAAVAGDQFVPGFEAGFELDGLLAGGQIGALAQFGNFVLGVQGDVSRAGLSGNYDFGFGPFPNISMEVNWLASLTARGGIALDSVLLYGLAGLAMADTTVKWPGGSADPTYTGYTVGAGVAVKLDTKWSVFGEYAYYGLGEQEFDGDTYDLTLSNFKVGLNYKF
ncbi:porin family protein [Aminobacter anthyllidis]|uniref:Porin family protein n=1 Tax=Aminobacter anthyllidis TaxID=1035067 RepID=A0A9X1AGR2_9HYPH|nr:outer membrane beta-barrel protein [Aminobacter anthyllidis]MBT1159684.1 porin family protein [Aminobacter anthyllidis]MDH4987991.1 outer membrane beta-barrel protein [Aminobacter anthyllidis]